MRLTVQVTVVGCGQVGMACIYSLLVREEVASICIADIDRKKLLGEVSFEKNIFKLLSYC